MRIVFFGLPLAAVLLHADGHEIALAAISRAPSPGLRRLRRLVGGDQVLLRPALGDPRLVARVRALAPDLLVSWFWTTRLPMQLVRAAKLGGLGVHPSLLPRHRGPDPTYWTIASGDEETGVTAHRIAADYDTGEILGQTRVAVDPAWNAWQLARALDAPSLRLLRATVDRFQREGQLPGNSQDEALASRAPFPSEDDLWIAWSWPTERVVRHVRALAPAPGAVTEIAGRLVTVLRARPAERWPAVLAPGEAVLVDDVPLVRTADGAVLLVEARVEPEDTAPDGTRAEEATDLSALFLPSRTLVIG